MPEGDTIHKLARYMRPRLVGARTITVRSGYRDTHMLSGERVANVDARGKHLMVAFDNGWLLRSHLGMHGSWHRYAHDEPWKRPERQATIVLETDDEVFVCFNAKEVQVIRTRGIIARGFASRLGPDLAGEDFDDRAAVARAREILDPETPIADVLLDQRAACGIGNVYKSEVLFLAGQYPMTAFEAVGDPMLGKLYLIARRLLLKNLGGGPRVTRFEGDGAGSLWVYGRRDKACLECDSPIRYTRLGRHMRSTYWCPSCQPN
ncbi:MAG: DNA-formamidopyrimidine glycosylase family protein [Chromatiales bacterium]|jgi:endonuclease-8